MNSGRLPNVPLFVNPRDIDRPRFLRCIPFLRGFPARALHAGRGSETLVGGTGMNFSPPWRSVCLEIYIRRMPYRIIAGPAGDASLALMTERSRIFTFNIIESRPLVERAGEHPRFVGRFQYAQLETAQFSRWLPCGDRGHAFLSSRCANTLVCTLMLTRWNRNDRSIGAKKDLVNYREILVRLKRGSLLLTKNRRYW